MGSQWFRVDGMENRNVETSQGLQNRPIIHDIPKTSLFFCFTYNFLIIIIGRIIIIVIITVIIILHRLFRVNERKIKLKEKYGLFYIVTKLLHDIKKRKFCRIKL